MNKKMRELMARTKIIDRAKAPTFSFPPVPGAEYAVQIRVKLTHALTMKQAEDDAATLLASLPPEAIGFELVESEVYEY